jgi:hypothetical protein
VVDGRLGDDLDPIGECPPTNETRQGFNIRRWSERGLNYRAVSDLAADELAEFGDKFETAMRSGTVG